MNLQLHDILANPVLLKDVSDETLQSWIHQYPYVSLFHLYALKKKNKYSESDLHKTAFYFNNREKLYFLLNDKQIESDVIASYEKTNTIPPPIEIKEEIVEEKITESIVEEKVKEVIEKEIEPIIEERTEVKKIEPIIEDRTSVDHHEQDTISVAEPKAHEETVLEVDISTALIEEDLSTYRQEITEEISIEEDIKSPFEEVEETIIPVVLAEDKPLSIADRIMLEIQQLKEERVQKANETEVVEEEKNIIEEIIIETEEEKIESIEEPVTEEALSADRQEKTETIVEEESTEEDEIIEEKQESIEEEKTEVTEEILPIPEIIEEVSIINEEIIPETKKEEKTLSIQDEVIARINKIKEERLLKISEEKNIATTIKEETEISISEDIEPIKEELIAEVAEEKEIILEPVIENVIEGKKEEVEEIKKEKPLSIQEEIVARIQKIKEERAKKTSEETTTEIPVQETVVTPEIIDIPETIEIVEKTEPEKEVDIKISEETTQPVYEVTDKKNSTSEILENTSTDEYEKEIELIETKLQEETEQENIEVKSSEKTTDTLPEIIEEINTEETNQFTTAFPEPLLVTVDTTHLKEEKIIVTEEQLKEEIIVPIKDILENETNQPEAVKEIVEEKLQEEIIENTSLISKKSDLFIPSIEEDKIEAKIEEKTIEEGIQHSTINIQHLKEEPHTFVEWLKLLDGNLQIQTSETIKETENWIEIPRYEVEQAIANKIAIQKEEQKLFEPNFEEGEVDLFNEIDEEVTKVASESVSFKQDMMTETLAKIYQKQGKTDKALEIYNTLLLKFPEKSAYFAGLIKKIEKEK